MSVFDQNIYESHGLIKLYDILSENIYNTIDNILLNKLAVKHSNKEILVTHAISDYFDLYQTRLILDSYHVITTISSVKYSSIKNAKNNKKIGHYHVVVWYLYDNPDDDQKIYSERKVFNFNFEFDE